MDTRMPSAPTAHMPLVPFSPVVCRSPRPFVPGNVILRKTQVKVVCILLVDDQPSCQPLIWIIVAASSCLPAIPLRNSGKRYPQKALSVRHTV